MCSFLPADLSAKCLTYVTTFGPVAIDMLKNEKPKDLCALLTACNSSVAVHMPYMTVPIPEDPGTVLYVQCTVKPVLSNHSKRRPKIVFQDRLSLNECRKYCRMLQWEHSAILVTFIKLSFVIKIFVLSIFEWPLKTGFIVYYILVLTLTLCLLVSAI